MKKIRYLILSLVIGGFGVMNVPAVANAAFDFDLSVSRKAQNDEVAELLKAANELYKQKKFDEALAICAKAAALNPKDFRPHTVSGIVYMAQWKMKSASESFARAGELKPDNKYIFLYKAKADRFRNARDESVVASRKALELDPNFAEAHFLIGEVLQSDEKRRDESEQAFRAAIKADPKFLDAYMSLGSYLAYTRKDEKGAEEILRQAINLDPDRMAGRFELGRMMVRQNRLKEARMLWEGRTRDEERTFPKFIEVLERAERLQKATDALAKKPNDPETLLAMGNAVMEGDSWVVDGRQEKAIVHFQKALTIKPDFTAAQYGIVKAYIEIADISRNKNKNVDEELAKLKNMDAKLAAEMEEYRKTYSGALKVGPPAKIDQ